MTMRPSLSPNEVTSARLRLKNRPKSVRQPPSSSSPYLLPLFSFVSRITTDAHVSVFRYLTALPFSDFISTIRTHYHHPSNHDPDHDQQTPSTARSYPPSSSPQPSSPAKPRPRPRPQLVENLRWRVKWEKTLERKRRNSASALTSDASNSSLHLGAEDATYSSFLTSQISSAPAPAPVPAASQRTPTPSSLPLLSPRLYTARSIYGVLIRPEWIEKAKERYKLRKEAQIGGYGGGSRGWRWRVGKHRVGFGRQTNPIESKTW